MILCITHVPSSYEPCHAGHAACGVLELTVVIDHQFVSPDPAHLSLSLSDITIADLRTKLLVALAEATIEVADLRIYLDDETGSMYYHCLADVRFEPKWEDHVHDVIRDLAQAWIDWAYGPDAIENFPSQRDISMQETAESPGF